MFFKPDKIAEEQRDSKQMEDLDICWIKVISDSGYRTDLRNEASAKTGRQLAEIPFVQKKMESVSNVKMEKVAKEMAPLFLYVFASFFFSSVSFLNLTSTQPYFSLI